MSYYINGYNTCKEEQSRWPYHAVMKQEATERGKGDGEEIVGQ